MGQDHRFEDPERLLASFSRHLDDYSATLLPDERQLLGVLLRRAMTPAERIRVEGGRNLLTPDEERFLEILDAENPGG